MDASPRRALGSAGGGTGRRGRRGSSTNRGGRAHMGAEDLQGWKRLKGRGGQRDSSRPARDLIPSHRMDVEAGWGVVGGRRSWPSEGQMVNDATGHFLLLSSLRLGDTSPLSSPPCP